MTQSNIDIKPNTKILYLDPEVKKLWKPRIERVRAVSAKAELTTFILGMRRVYVYHENSERYINSYEFLRENDLVFYPTDKSAVYSGFSHRHLPVVEGKPYTVYGAVVRRTDQEAGELFTKYSARPVNHVEIGKLLGYEDCCIDWFNEVWGNISLDPMYEIATNTEGVEIKDNVATVQIHPYCNPLLRYWGIKITPHLPHSMTCAKTIKQGKKWYTIMRRIDSKAAKWAKELLSMPITWNALKGAAVIDIPIFRGITNSDTTLTKKVIHSPGWKGKV